MLSRDIVLWVNSNDMALGKAMLADVHERHLMHRLGVLFIQNSMGRYFLTRRANDESWFPQKTDATASFHIPANESWEEAVKRETFEQTGYRRMPDFVGHFVLDRDPEHVYGRVYQAVFDGPVTLNPRIHAAGRFMLADDIHKGLPSEDKTPWLLPSWKTLGEKAASDARAEKVREWKAAAGERFKSIPRL